MRPKKGKFKLALSYPGQFINARVVKSNWKKVLSKKEYSMDFNIQNMIVLKKRNKPRKKCNTDWKNDDESQLKKLVQEIGCRPSHFTMNTTVPKCLIWFQLDKFNNTDVGDYFGPCRQVEKLLYSYGDYPRSLTNDAGNGTVFEVRLNFQGETYMEIEQSRAYDFQTLVGNAGGYVGVFLGVALIQLPIFFLNVFNYIQQWFQRN